MNYEEAPLHKFERQLKLPVDLGMFFFGLSNAGVSLNTVGHLTSAVIFALVVGKTLGIACFSMLASAFGFGLPAGVTKVDLFAMSALGGVGLTVALFVANQAFIDPTLKGQAKFAAVLSVFSAGVAAAIRSLGNRGKSSDQFDMDDSALASSWSDADYLDSLLVDDIMQILWVHQRYQARGVSVSMKELAQATPVSSRKSSKRSSLPQGFDNNEITVVSVEDPAPSPSPLRSAAPSPNTRSGALQGYDGKPRHLTPLRRPSQRNEALPPLPGRAG
jgi:hypothetical protein